MFERAPWFATLGGNYYHPEGDVEYDDNLGIFGKLGYSFNAWWDLEGSLNYMPALSAKDASELNKPEYALAGRSVGACAWAWTRCCICGRVENRRIDPFLRAGTSITFLNDDMENGKNAVRIACGRGPVLPLQ